MQKQLLQKLFADAGFETPRVLNEMQNATDFYFEAIGQVKMDPWSRGRVTLVGDAGYCASLFSGMGTSLAFIGAYILAGEIGRHRDHTEAFRQYEVLMRPYVTRDQKLIPGCTRVAAPQTATGIALRNALFSFAAKPAVIPLITKLTESKTDEKVTLPDYEALFTQQQSAL
jgi:2-polyprenyl-6-methoxyphenol hydroxylase-like FAD-dependent oxidoreductase